MAAGTDFAIREFEEKLIKRLNKIMDKFNRIDRAEWILAQNPSTMKRVLNKWSSDLDIVKDFFANDNILGAIVRDATKRITKSLGQFEEFADFAIRKSQQEFIIKSVQSEFSTAISGIMDQFVKKQFGKMITFKRQADLIALPLAQARERLERIAFVEVKGLKFDKLTVEEIWDLMNNRFGKFDQVLFPLSSRTPSGKIRRQPLSMYIEGKIKTMGQEAHNLTVVTTGARAGINTGRVSAHASKDSCLLHEGTIIFLSNAGKNIFLEKHGESFPQAKTWKTLSQLREDNTHIFKFNCNHSLSLLPVTIMTEGQKNKLPRTTDIPLTAKGVRSKTKRVVKAKKIA